MLVIVSDIHLTDGTSGETIRSGAFRIFRERLRALAFEASWRTGGKYRPLQEIDVVLMGDIFDAIRSTKWCDAPPIVRPWGNPADPAFSDLLSEITEGIASNNADSLAILRSCTDGKAVSLPPATPDGDVVREQEGEEVERVPVSVQFHYMVGNHDWMYHLKGAQFDAIRAKIKAATGLVTPADQPFPWDRSESAVIDRLFREHNLHARHGDVFDSSNYDGNRDRSSLGDAIVIELIDRFPREVQERVPGLSGDCAAGLKEIDNVRPIDAVPDWLDGLLRRTATVEQTRQIKAIWDELVDRFLALPFVQQHKTLDKYAFKFSTGFSIATLAKMLRWVKKNLKPLVGGLGWLKDRPSWNDATTEPQFRSAEARYFAYGHTHYYEVVPLRSRPPGSSFPDQIYFNSGTWRLVHDPTVYKPSKEEFVAYHVMTFLCFFKGDERGGRSFESWSGTLRSTG